MSEPGSIGNMPIRAASVGSRNRLRLISLLVPSPPESPNAQTQLPSSERQASTAIRLRSARVASGLSRLESHPV